MSLGSNKFDCSTKSKNDLNTLNMNKYCENHIPSIMVRQPVPTQSNVLSYKYLLSMPRHTNVLYKVSPGKHLHHTVIFFCGELQCVPTAVHKLKPNVSIKACFNSINYSAMCMCPCSKISLHKFLKSFFFHLQKKWLYLIVCLRKL